jgi:hypothetical protein
VPAQACLEIGEDAAGLASGLAQIRAQIFFEEAANLATKGFVLGAECQVHRFPPVRLLPKANRRARRASSAELTGAFGRRYDLQLPGELPCAFSSPCSLFS